MGTVGTDVGRRIVEQHGGRTGAELAVSVLAQSDPVMAGRLLGMTIVKAYDGKTGGALAEAMAGGATSCASKTTEAC